jgi:hypothetical protein
MKMNGTGMRIGVTVLALGVSLLAIPSSQTRGTQRAIPESECGLNFLHPHHPWTFETDL